ncbi:hypothetical protein ACFYY1_30065 [Streptomyces sp. NPDC001890]|uniref:hypothetical protein n=1 Tax=Streptomyces sp. NPDC001890 TaxID=3364620 RepID=UPI003680668D
MATNSQAPRERKNLDRTCAAALALLQLSSRRHKFWFIVERSGLSSAEVQRRLLQLIDAKLCQLLRNAVRAAVERTVFVARPDFAAGQAS